MKTLARRECQAEIVRRLRAVRPESARLWGQMSAHQMICHLADGLRMAAGEKPVTGASGRFKGTFVKWIALYLPLRWPPGIPTSPEIDQRCGGTTPLDFAADVAEVEARLEDMAARAKDVVWPRHPVFGRMSRAAWLRWAYVHTDHHLRQFGA